MLCSNASYIKDESRGQIIIHTQCTCIYNKTRSRTSIRRQSPCRNAALLSILSTFDWSTVLICQNTQLGFNLFYALIYDILNNIYPEQSVTITSRDPLFVTPQIKAICYEVKINL